MPLHPQNEPVVLTASPSAVAKTLSGIVPFTKHGRWLGKTNRYAVDTIAKIAADIAPGQAINQRNLAQYISVSSLLHATDGWSYLGRSLQSLLHGDPHRALHMAYYAELRASMSLLACVGIGVFNNRHFVIPAANTAASIPVKSSTHDFAWDALSYWSQQQTSGALFTRIVRPYGRTLEEWLTPIGGGAAVLPKTQEWFKQWGMDLDGFGGDRDSRNARSYRPTGLPEPWPLSARIASTFVSDAWSLLEPSGSSFEQIDRHILRLSIESRFRGLTGTEPSPTTVAFAAMVNKVINYQGLSQAVAGEWRNFLLRLSSPTDPEAVRYSAVRPNDSADDTYGVISRATLLLRMATGATHDLFEAAGVPSDALGFWRTDLGSSRGFWGTSGQPDLLTDLWSEISSTSSDIAAFLSLEPPAEQNFSRLAAILAPSATVFGGCERVALWSVLPPQ